MGADAELTFEVKPAFLRSILIVVALLSFLSFTLIALCILVPRSLLLILLLLLLHFSSLQSFLV